MLNINMTFDSTYWDYQQSSLVQAIITAKIRLTPNLPRHPTGPFHILFLVIPKQILPLHFHYTDASVMSLVDLHPFPYHYPSMFRAVAFYSHFQYFPFPFAEIALQQVPKNFV
jgi:hypothetical protein